MNLGAETASRIAAAFDLRKLPATFYEDPYPHYRALRESDPIKRLPDGSVFMTRYEDLLAVYKDPRTFSSDKRAEFLPKFGASPLFEHHTTSLVFNDPPLHTRVRRLIAGALMPRHIAAMEPSLVDYVRNLLDKMQACGKVDLVRDFAGAIPVEIIGNLLNVPRADRAPLRGWSLAVLSALEPTVSASVLAVGNAAVVEMLSYLGDLVRDRRANLGDPETDVLSRLIVGEAAEGRLTEQELMHNCIFLLNAGHETTTNLIGNALVTLFREPQAIERLRGDPTLYKTAIDEILRLESPNQLGNRITTREVAVGGVNLEAGAQVTLCIGAANRDPAQFEDPDRLEIARTPNRHLAFGFAHHQCIGMNLGRLEARVAVSMLLQRFSRFKLLGAPVRGGRARFRGFQSIPCELAV